jgi:hypothetical protein
MARKPKLAAPGILFDAIEDDTEEGEKSGEDTFRDSYQNMRGDAADHARNPIRGAHLDMTTDELRALR